MSLSKRVRFDVFKRDSFTCRYCGKRPPDVMLEVDHIIPRCEGGSDDPSNLTTACLACNRGKAGVPLGELAPAVDEMAILEGVQEMLERAVSLRRATAVEQAQKAAEDDAVITFADWYVQAFGTDRYVEPGTVRYFLRRIGLAGLRDALIAAEVGAERNRLGAGPRWKYFCGVCHNKLKALDTERERDDEG